MATAHPRAAARRAVAAPTPRSQLTQRLLEHHDADRLDEAFALGGQTSAESYLVFDKILDAAAKSGTYTYQGVEYPRIQILSIDEIMAAKREFKTPSKVGSKIGVGQSALPIG